jgi:hypothetical protein
MYQIVNFQTKYRFLTYFNPKGPFDYNETILIWYFIFNISGKIWSPQSMIEITQLLKRKRYEDNKSLLIPRRILISVPSSDIIPKHDGEIKIIDWSYSSEILSAKLFDILMVSKNPKFHRETTKLSINV